MILLLLAAVYAASVGLSWLLLRHHPFPAEMAGSFGLPPKCPRCGR